MHNVPLSDCLIFEEEKQKTYGAMQNYVFFIKTFSSGDHKENTAETSIN